ncbi:MAG TPA: carbohydrate kinase [Acidimicrobiales bacterium]|nr:carbohydrate kinase [Acidimicrobiales bacterium]
MSALVVGECLVDLAPAATPEGGGASGPVAHELNLVALPGGSPANVALGLARLAVPTSFAGRFSGSGFGPWLRAHLEANGVDLSPSVNAPEPATMAVVTLDKLGQARYTFYGPETADWHWAAAELPARPKCRVVHTGSLATTMAPGAAVIARWVAALREQGEVVISFDPNVRPGLVADIDAYRLAMEQLVARAHIVKASTADIATVYPGQTVGSVIQRWLELGCTLVLSTDGEHGATAAHRRGARFACAPPQVKVVDTIGAGDSFSSGLLAYLDNHGLLSEPQLDNMDAADIGAALAHAVAASAYTCTRPGADPPDSATLASFLAEQPPQYGPHPLE